ncbi:MAG: VOC family protein [Archangium sp.]|nr:VOC family protein [Archangium sp.]
MSPFFQVTLRTSDVAAARAFYASVLGDVVLDVVQLHEQAVARGARPHWLGFVEVGDVDLTAAAFVARGAAPLGPKWVNPAGLEAAVLRDPGGAIVALGKPPGPTTGSGVDWFLLNTNDVERARANYGELFGWAYKAPLELGALGVFHPFSWGREGPVVGSMSDLSGRPGVHPHWLFHFPVAGFDAAVEAVKRGGGVVAGPMTLPSGERIAVCDDPQGAAFALRHEGVRS